VRTPLAAAAFTAIAFAAARVGSDVRVAP